MKSISPLDGRYLEQVKELRDYFSEFALVKYRLEIEIEYFVAFIQVVSDDQLDEYDILELKHIYQAFCEQDFDRVKVIESSTKHDVKAVEYFFRERLQELGLTKPYQLMCPHFGLTSSDIDSPAIVLQLKDAINNVMLPMLESIIGSLTDKVTDWNQISMLSRTHGQPATPTKLGKEIQVFRDRLLIQQEKFLNYKWYAKMGGAVGNLNAHYLAYPAGNWKSFFEALLLNNWDIIREHTTTQIGSFDNISELFNLIAAINTIFIDFNRDMWSYISLGYFNLKTSDGEVGSSTMPHKINPILFENSEGNLLYANCVLQFMSTQLPLSKMQRDLVNSTILRNNGVAIGHTLLAWKNLKTGIQKLVPNLSKLNEDLNHDWSVMSEPIQIILKTCGISNGYEIVKNKFRTSQVMKKEDYLEFVNNLDKYVENPTDPNECLYVREAKGLLLNLTIEGYSDIRHT